MQSYINNLKPFKNFYSSYTIYTIGKISFEYSLHLSGLVSDCSVCVGVQTDVHPTTTDQLLNGNNPTSMSPIPSVDAASDLLDQIKQLEKLANRYRNTALKFQSKYESSEAIKSELAKQLQETQQESSEMVEFLQAEKSTLAESLTEIETEVGYILQTTFYSLQI